MKTSELVSKLTSMGYQVKVQPMSLGDRVFVYAPDGTYAGYVCTKLFGILSTDTSVTTSGKSSYDTGDVNNLVEYLMKYALTPLAEREDIKKYLVKMLPKGDNYLNQSRADNHIFFSSADRTDMYKTRFTEEEYSNIQERYDKWLPEFDKDDPHFVEVQDDNNSEPVPKMHDNGLIYPDEEFTKTY